MFEMYMNLMIIPGMFFAFIGLVVLFWYMRNDKDFDMFWKSLAVFGFGLIGIIGGLTVPLVIFGGLAYGLARVLDLVINELNKEKK